MRCPKPLFCLAAIIFLFAVSSSVIAAPRKNAKQSLSDLLLNATNSVVLIESYDKEGKAISQGSGFIVRPDGTIVTNHHVTEGAHSAIVKLPSGAFFPVEGVIASREEWDLIAIHVGGRGLSVLSLGSSQKLRIGDEVFAVGNPQGLENTVSKGIVSAFRKPDDSSYQVIQTTAPVSPGSSGGPLLDHEGNVVGVMTFVAEGQNLNFAVPVEIVLELLENPASHKESVADSGSENSAAYQYMVGILARDNGNFQVAEEFFKKATETDPNHADAYRELADIYYRRSEFDKELVLRQRVAELLPKDSRSYLALGVALESVGKEPEAISAYQKTLTLNPLNIDASYNLTFLYILHGKLKEAEAELNNLKKLNPRFADQLGRLINKLR